MLFLALGAALCFALPVMMFPALGWFTVVPALVAAFGWFGSVLWGVPGAIGFGAFGFVLGAGLIEGMRQIRAEATASRPARP